MSAAAEFHPDATPDANVAAMAAAAETLPDRAGAGNGRGRAAVTRVVDRLVAGAPDAEVLTLVDGGGVPGVAAAAVADALRRSFPRLRVERLRDGRAPFAYQIGLD